MAEECRTLLEAYSRRAQDAIRSFAMQGTGRGVRGAVLVVLATALGACGGGGSGGDKGGTLMVTLGGAPLALVQGETTGRGKLANGTEVLTVILSSDTYDRCSRALFDFLSPSTDTAFALLTMPYQLGTYDASSLGAGAATGKGIAQLTRGLNTDLVLDGTVQTLAIDGATVTARIDGTLAASGASFSGTFTADTCGFSGQNLFKLEACDVPNPGASTSANPAVEAVSPGGRATALYDGVLSVYERTAAADGGCTYALDPAYGQGGMVTLPKTIWKWTFDGEERLYVATEPPSLPSTSNQVPGSLYRITPGGGIDSCSFPLVDTGAVSSGPPSYLTVMPDGSTAYLAWENGSGIVTTEWSLDLTSPLFSPQDVTCDLVMRDPNGPRYTDALSIDPAGALFIRSLATRLRATVTDLSLVPQRYFGGTPSGKGEQGLGGVSMLSHCSAGFCVATDYALEVYNPSGTFLQMIDLGTELGAQVQPRGLAPAFAPDGGGASAAYLHVDTTFPDAGNTSIARIYKLSAAVP